MFKLKVLRKFYRYDSSADRFLFKCIPLLYCLERFVWCSAYAAVLISYSEESGNALGPPSLETIPQHVALFIVFSIAKLPSEGILSPYAVWGQTFSVVFINPVKSAHSVFWSVLQVKHFLSISNSSKVKNISVKASFLRIPWIIASLRFKIKSKLFSGFSKRAEFHSGNFNYGSTVYLIRKPVWTVGLPHMSKLYHICYEDIY